MSIYRVSTLNQYDKAIQNIQQRQVSMGQSQAELSSGKRVAKASDDAVAATLSERTQQRMARAEADLRGLEASRRSLAQAESTLSDVGDLYGRFKELVTQSGNAALSASDRMSIANEIRGLRERVLALANQKDAAGNALFGGLGVVNNSGDPFVESLNNPATDQTTYGPDGRSVTWNGTRGQPAATPTSLPTAVDGYAAFKGASRSGASAIVATTSGNGRGVSVNVTNPASLNANVFDFSADALGGTQGDYSVVYQSATNDYLVTPRNAAGTTVAPGAFTVTPSIVGNSVELSFEGMSIKLSGTPTAGDAFTVTPAVDRDIWETMDRVIGALETNETGSDLSQELAVAHQQLQGREDQLLQARGRLGDWLNRADTMETVLKDRNVSYQKENSELVDADMLKAVTNFQTNQTAYQAALQSYAQVQKMSMFDYMR